LIKFFVISLSVALFLALAAAGGALYVFWEFGRGLPDYRQLAQYDPPVMTRVHAGDGTLMAEYARERRLFVPITAIPRQVVQAFLSAEDKTFYTHPGIDIFGIASATVRNLRNMGSNRRPVGASTITQQVAKNFLLSGEVSYERKIKEAILAFRIEQAFSKDRILELYMNEIYLGFGSYGVAAAALNYFNKSMDELTLEETAFLAALPKAPNNYHPYRRREAAIARRNWVLSRMVDDDAITAEEADLAAARPLIVRAADPTRVIRAAHFAEEVRRELVQRYGENRLYGGGLSVRTTLEPELQDYAESALRKGLVDYDRRHGWRGPIGRIKVDDRWQQRLANRPPAALAPHWELAVVLDTTDTAAKIGFADGHEALMPLSGMTWARRYIDVGERGPVVNVPSDVVAAGDVVAVAPMVPAEADTADADGDKAATSGKDAAASERATVYGLQQIPEVDGALVAMDPHTGRVLAMVGGFSFDDSQFNRASQAMRQPGSSFKPFVYAAALDAGFTPSSLVLDAPFVIDLGPELGRWKPSNYTRRFYGPSTLRLGIEKSRNLMTVRLANYIGMERVIDYAQRFGIVEEMPPFLPMALGAGETTLLRMVSAYSVLVNGGKRVTPTLIDRIQDRQGATIFRHDGRLCEGCRSAAWSGQAEPDLPDVRPEVIDATTAYQVVSMLEGVVIRGTGRRIAAVGKPLAGKTGTTNESRDTWFLGFSPDLAVGVYAGFDQPRSLGRRETGSSVAAPIFADFMGKALANEPAIPFRVPRGVQLVRVDPGSGMPTAQRGRRAILEAFKPGTVPRSRGPVLDGSLAGLGTAGRGTAPAGTGGLY